MDTTIEQLRQLSARAVQAAASEHEFIFKVVKQRCDHNLQITVDAGTEPGPWLRLGVNDQALIVGYVPKKRRAVKKK